MLVDLPAEVLWDIMSGMAMRELSMLRLVCKRLRRMADHPSHWHDIFLEPTASSSTLTLWRLDEIKSIIEPHRKFIRTIRIRGVRDCIVRYLLQCPRLEELIMCQWRTLSNHAFKPPCTSQRLRRLVLVGSTDQFNYASVDAVTLGRFIKQCPSLCELILGCQAHIHTQTLLDELRKSKTQLQPLTISTHEAWSEEHGAETLELSHLLEKVRLGRPTERQYEFNSKLSNNRD